MDNSSSILTPVSLWKDFVIDREFMESCISSFDFDGVTSKTLYFSGRRIKDNAVRIFCSVCYPTGQNCKNFIVMVGDPSESINFELIKTFVKFGYGVLMPDLKGNTGIAEDNFTRYPEEISYADYVNSEFKRNFIEDNVKNTPWYEWACVVRYSVEYVKSAFNAENVALFGVKQGANVCWMSLTENVKCFVDLFGAGWNGYKDLPEKEPTLLTDEQRKFVAGIDAESYAPYCNCPVMYLTATNSKEFDCEACSDTILRTKGDKFFVFSSGQQLYLSKQSITSCELFLKKYLSGDNDCMPKSSPTLEISLKDGLVKFEFGLSDSENVSEVKLFSSSGNSASFKKNWAVIYEGTKSVFYLEEKKFSDLVTCYLSVKYHSGAELCSPIMSMKLPSYPKKLIAPLFAGNKNDNTFIGRAIENEVLAGLFYADEGVEIIKGPFEIKGAFSKNGLITYKITDYKNLLDKLNDIKFDLYCSSFIEFIIGIFCDENGKEVHYKYKLKVKGAKVWQNFCLCFDDFKSDNGKSIKDNSKIYAFSFYSADKFILNNILVY